MSNIQMLCDSEVSNVVGGGTGLEYSLMAGLVVAVGAGFTPKTPNFQYVTPAK